MLAQVRETYLADNYELWLWRDWKGHCRKDMPIYSTLPNFDTLLVHYSLTYCQWLRCKVKNTNKLRYFNNKVPNWGKFWGIYLSCPTQIRVVCSYVLRMIIKENKPLDHFLLLTKDRLNYTKYFKGTYLKI